MGFYRVRDTAAGAVRDLHAEHSLHPHEQPLHASVRHAGLGACGGAPAMQIGMAYRENITPENVEAILAAVE